jgi:GMP synthase (glutamine-hydrolysing)
MKVLVVNCYLDAKLAREFELEIIRNLVLPDAPVELNFVALHEDMQDGWGDFSRLLVSGSEATAWEDNPWDEPLAKLIEAFVAASRPVLGICYGHQIIIRALVGREHLRRRRKRVWGWLELDLAESRIFQGLERIVSVTCNSDEVFNLPPEYRILAGADHCRVLAYEHRDKPIWGVQFHPEYDWEYGTEVLNFTMELADKTSFTYLDQRRDETCLRANTRLFANFLQA